MDKKLMTIDLLFDDGVLHLIIEPPDGFLDTEFDIWSLGVSAGVASYLNATQQDRNFQKIKTQMGHKHRFKFVEPSELNDILWFYCIECNDLGQINREIFNQRLLGKRV